MCIILANTALRRKPLCGTASTTATKTRTTTIIDIVIFSRQGDRCKLFQKGEQAQLAVLVVG